MRRLLFGVFRLGLLAVLTFAFVVLFEHGSAKFSEGAKTEWNALLSFIGSTLSKQSSAQPARSATTPAPAPNPAVSRPKGVIDGGTNRPARATPAGNH